jgi:AraC family transcriptional regulator
VRSKMVADPASARSAALQLVMLLSAPPTTGAAMARGGLAPWQLRKLDRYLRENLADSLRLPMLAGEINLSVSHFNRSFKASRGLTPHSYIVKLRMELAQSLMVTTGDPLCEIALTCGLADQAHLTKLFRRHYRETPAAWRRRHFNGDGPPVARARDVADQLIRSVPRAQSNDFAPFNQKEGRERNARIGGVAIHWATAGPLPIGPAARVGASDGVF